MEWFGVTTFRLRLGKLTVMLDGYIERIGRASGSGQSVKDVAEADWILVGQGDFDHIGNVLSLASRTGATVVANHHVLHQLRGAGLPDAQGLPISGGEPIPLNPDVKAVPIPALHSHVWAPHSADPDKVLTGDLDINVFERRRRDADVFKSLEDAALCGPEIARHVAGLKPHDFDHGGTFAFRISTPVGSIIFKNSSGHWSGLLPSMRADVAILAISQRANVDGEPFQGAWPSFMADEVKAIEPKTVVMCHHDDWLPPFTPAKSVEPLRLELERRGLSVRVIDPSRGQRFPLFA
ncbi:MBL fold metallo-hydrolase [Bradyrhizobium sp. CCBAU 53421]|uniref:MBL fold metallo-hydrolase n=1 Tax=Bradyrhizobium sp. CCBAU 53421 TaxID=1325120 RepID=UPI00188D1EBE|nr:hypothetical protein [Bradyrhizobium sp. CCBAU 53421]